MKLSLGIYALSLALALGSATAMAETSTVGGTTTGTADAGNGTAGAPTDNGMTSLGVDISNAGNTSTSIQSFTGKLTPEQQTQLKSRCESVSANPAKYAQNIQDFCKDASM